MSLKELSCSCTLLLGVFERKQKAEAQSQAQEGLSPAAADTNGYQVLPANDEQEEANDEQEEADSEQAER